MQPVPHRGEQPVAAAVSPVRTNVSSDMCAANCTTTAQVAVDLRGRFRALSRRTIRPNTALRPAVIYRKLSFGTQAKQAVASSNGC